MKRLYIVILLTVKAFGLYAQTIQQLKDSAAAYPPMPEGAAGLIPLVESMHNLTFASSTPYNDLEYSLFDTDFIEGETAGYDVFCPVDPADDFPGANTVKLVLCVSNVLTNNIYQAAQGDRVILGIDEIEYPFFMRGLDGIDNDYAVIRHFDYKSGHIQLQGNPSDYSLIYCTKAEGCATEGWYLFYTKDEHIDLIAFIFPCWDVDIVMPNQDTTLMCNSDNMLDLYNPDQFRYAQPVSRIPALDKGLVQFGSNGKDIVHGIVVDKDGNIYSYGTGDGNLDGQDNPDNEMFVIKFDPEGNQLWVTEFGNRNGDLIFDAVADNDYLYAAGRTLGNLPGFQNQGLWDAIVVKIQLEDGKIVAMNQWGNVGIDGYGNITLDDAGNLYMSGAGSPEYGPSSGDNRYLLAKHSAATLENIWRAIDPVLPTADKVTEAWGGITYIPADEPGKGRLVIGGWFRPPGSPPKGADGFVTLYDHLDQISPTIQAVQQISSPGFRADWVLDNAVDSDGNIYAVGYTTGNLSGTHLGEGDMFVVKFDSTLANPKYAQWGTNRSDMFRKLEVDASNQFHAIGYTYGNYAIADYQGEYHDTSSMSGDVVIQKFDTNLNRLQTLQFGTPYEERGFACLHDSMLYIAGLTEGSMVSGNLGSFDGYLTVLKKADLSFIRPEILSVADYSINHHIHLYPNPTSGQVQFDTGESENDLKKIVVCNSMGQTVRIIDTQSNAVDISDFPNGLYFVRLEFVNGNIIRKIIKE